MGIAQRAGFSAHLGRALMVLGAALMIGLAPVPARAQSGDLRELLNRIDRMERDLIGLQRQVYAGASAPAGGTGGTAVGMPPAAAADIQLRLDGLETALRSLTGEIERFGFEQNQLRGRVDKLVVDVDFRLQELERARPQAALAPAPGAPQPAAAPTLTLVPGPEPVTAAPVPATLPGGTPEEQYRYAFSLLQKADYDQAELALMAFIQVNPDHPRAANAQYWMGETHYVRKDYTKAAITFAEGYERYPTGNKASDNLLKLALSLGNLGKNAEACASLAQLASQFPNAAPTIKRRADAEGRRLDCG